MRPVEIRPGFGHRRQPMRDPLATLIVAVILAAIVASGFALILQAGGVL